MATVGTEQLMTADEFWEWCQLPENLGKRLELERGEVVEMSSPGEVHGTVCWWISSLLAMYVMKRGRGRAATNDTGVIVKEGPDTVRGPDIVFFDETRPLDQLNWKHTRQVPTLIIEILSPNDKPNKVTRRISDYLHRGIPLVWIVDADDRTVAVHRKGELPRTLDEKDELTGDDVLPDLKLLVADLFKLPGT